MYSWHETVLNPWRQFHRRVGQLLHVSSEADIESSLNLMASIYGIDTELLR
jgi:hypothetical protein